jgi:hypothetical protein
MQRAAELKKAGTPHDFRDERFNFFNSCCPQLHTPEYNNGAYRARLRVEHVERADARQAFSCVPLLLHQRT